MKRYIFKFTTVVALSTGIFIMNDKATVRAETNSITRLNGETRYETATKISQASFDSADTVVIANAMNFADALSGVPLAYQKDAPILLANGESLRTHTIDEIKRLNTKNAIILGGEFAISRSVENELKNMGLATKRLAGETRFETADIIANELSTYVSSDKAVVVDGYNFADAMSVAPFAAQEGMPIYLTRPNKLASEESLKKFSETVIIGGTNAVSQEVQNQLNKTVRIAGETRYETNVNVLNYFNVKSDSLYVSTGKQFADALTGSMLAAKNNSGVALVKNSIHTRLQEYLNEMKFSSIGIFGGEIALTNAISSELNHYVYESNVPEKIIDYDEIEIQVDLLLKDTDLEYTILDNRKYTGSMNINFHTPYGFSDNKIENDLVDKVIKFLDENNIEWILPRDKGRTSDFDYSIEILINEFTEELDYTEVKRILTDISEENHLQDYDIIDVLDGYLTIDVIDPTFKSEFLRFKIYGITFEKNNRVYENIKKILKEINLYDHYYDIADKSYSLTDYPVLYGYVFQGERWKPSEEDIKNIKRIIENYKTNTWTQGSYDFYEYDDAIMLDYIDGSAKNGDPLFLRLINYVKSTDNLDYSSRGSFSDVEQIHIWSKVKP